MSLSPREHHSLREIAERLTASDPHLVRMLRLGPAAARAGSRRWDVLGWRLLAALLFAGGYALAEYGLVRAGMALVLDGALLGVLALSALGWAGHRARCTRPGHE
jgi:hypothetical protein